MNSTAGRHVGSMPDWQRKILREKRRDLVQDLEVNYIINYMIQEDVLTREMCDVVNSKPTAIEKTEAFLDILPTRGQKAFWVFLGTLEDNYNHIYENIKEAADHALRAIQEEEARQSDIYEELSLHESAYYSDTPGPPSQFEHPQSYVTDIVVHAGTDRGRNKEVKPTVEVIADVTGNIVEECNGPGDGCISPDASLYKSTETFLGAAASPPPLAAAMIVDLRRPRVGNFAVTGKKIPIKKGCTAIMHTTFQLECLAVVMYRLKLVCIPLACVQDHGDPRNEIWYSQIPLTSEQAEQMLKDENREGLFVAYKPTHDNTSTPYEISLCLPNGTVKHYPIYKFDEGQIGFMNCENHFKSLKHLVDYHKLNRGILQCRLRTGLGELDEPVSFPKEWMINQEDVRFEEGNQLGYGCFGTVHLALYKRTLVAVKQAKPDPKSRESIVEEAQVLIPLKHDNILRLHGVICGDECSLVTGPSLVTECLRDGDLGSWLKKNTICDYSVCINICIQATAAVLYLHAQRWVLHRDVAAHSFQVTKTSDGKVLIKLADFSMARRVIDDCYVAEIDEKLSIRWLSPEVFQDGRYSSKSDIWSLGMLMWEVHTAGKKPFSSLNKDEVKRMVRDIRHSVLSSDPPKQCVPEMFEIMEKCFKYKPIDRPIASYVYEELVAYRDAFAGSEHHLQPVDQFALQRLARSCQDLASYSDIPEMMQYNQDKSLFARLKRSNKDMKNKSSHSPGK